jgi:hypothetical protein
MLIWKGTSVVEQSAVGEQVGPQAIYSAPARLGGAVDKCELGLATPGLRAAGASALVAVDSVRHDVAGRSGRACRPAQPGGRRLAARHRPVELAQASRGGRLATVRGRGGEVLIAHEEMARVGRDRGAGERHGSQWAAARCAGRLWRRPAAGHAPRPHGRTAPVIPGRGGGQTPGRLAPPLRLTPRVEA